MMHGENGQSTVLEKLYFLNIVNHILTLLLIKMYD